VSGLFRSDCPLLWKIRGETKFNPQQGKTTVIKRRPQETMRPALLSKTGKGGMNGEERRRWSEAAESSSGCHASRKTGRSAKTTEGIGAGSKRTREEGKDHVGHSQDREVLSPSGDGVGQAGTGNRRRCGAGMLKRARG